MKALKATVHSHNSDPRWCLVEYREGFRCEGVYLNPVYSIVSCPKSPHLVGSVFQGEERNGKHFNDGNNAYWIQIQEGAIA